MLPLICLASTSISLLSLPLLYKHRILLKPRQDTLSVPQNSYKDVTIPYTPKINSSLIIDNNGRYKQLAAWLIRPDAKQFIMVCCGNGGNKSYHLHIVDLLLKTFPDHGIFIFDYEGYGDSYQDDGANFDGLINSAETALDYVRQLSNEPLILFGTSMGSGVVCSLLALLQPNDKIIIQNGFPSISQLIKHHLPQPMRALYPLFFRNTFNNVQAIEQSSEDGGRPRICAIHCHNDEIIPFKLGEELGGHCDFFLPINGTHNQFEYDEATISALRQFTKMKAKTVTFHDD